jgi:hypothetical protein
MKVSRYSGICCAAGEELKFRCDASRYSHLRLGKLLDHKTISHGRFSNSELSHDWLTYRCQLYIL